MTAFTRKRETSMSNSGSTPSSTKFTGLICSPTNGFSGLLTSGDLSPLVTPVAAEPLASSVGDEEVVADAGIPAHVAGDVAARVVGEDRPCLERRVVRAAPRLLGREPRELDHVVALTVKVE